MNDLTKKSVYKITISGILIAAGTVLSMIKVYEMPLGGSVTLLSMVPVILAACMLGTKWGLATAFVYSGMQLLLGITDGLFSWGLTSTALVGTIFLDYLLPFTLLGLAGIFRKKGLVGIVAGTVFVMVARFLCHLLSGAIIFDIWCSWDNVWWYSFCYNGAYMLPELISTTIAVVLLFKLPQIKKIIAA